MSETPPPVTIDISDFACGGFYADHPVCTHGVHLRSRCDDCEGWTDMGES